jgi:hypothetical protein
MAPSAPVHTAHAQPPDKVDQLITLVDRWLHLCGTTLTTGPKLRSICDTPVEVPPPPNANIPVALQTYPNVSLNNHIRELEEEQATAEALKRRIREIHNTQPALVRAAHSRVAAEYAALNPEKKEPLPQSLAILLGTLRTQQHFTPSKPQTAKFKVIVIKALDMSGTPSETTLLHMAKQTTWAELALALQGATINAQNTDLGFPCGYTQQEGHWLVQATRDNKPLTSGPSYKIDNEQDYRLLRSQMASEKMDPVVWHECLWKRSQQLRQESAALRDRRSVDGDDFRDENGELYFEPLFDEGELWGLLDVTDLVSQFKEENEAGKEENGAGEGDGLGGVE